MLLNADDCQLVLVDYQAKLMPVIHDGVEVLKQAVCLAEVAKMLKVPVWGTEQNPSKLGANDARLKALCKRTLSKSHFSAVADGLSDWLRPAQQVVSGNARSLPKHLQKKREQETESCTVVLAGCETHVCLLQTALELVEEEYDVVVVTDACGSRTERNRDAAFDRMAGAGIELVTTEMVLFEWLRSHEHPLFPDVLERIR